MLGYQTSKYNLGVIPKMVYLFGTIFNDLNIPRMADDGTSLNQLIKVPITYAPKDKVLERVQADPKLDKKPAVQLPMLSYEHIDTVYDSGRKLSAMNRIAVMDTASTDHVKTQWTPVPYNFIFQLYLYAKGQLDLNNMIEQIFPFFTPELTIKADLIPETGKLWDIPVVLNQNQRNDQYQGAIADRRLLYQTLNFTVKGYLFGPIIKHPVIKFADVKFYDAVLYEDITDAVGHLSWIDRVTVQPGVDANGNPTTNVATSIPLANITANSNFGYIIDRFGHTANSEPSGGE